VEPTQRGPAMRRRLRAIAAVILVTLLAACGGGGGTGPATYTISVNVSGLSGAGLILQLNLAKNLAVAADGNFTFATALSAGASYMISVKTQPSSPAQVCVAPDGAGLVGKADVTGIAVNCTISTCPSLPSSSGAGSAPSPTLFVLDTGRPPGIDTVNSCIIGYPANSSGSVSPAVSIALPSGAAYSYQSLVTDSSGYIYVESDSGPQGAVGEVLVFAPGANGMATPVRTLVVPGGSLEFPNTIAVDGTGAIYVATFNSILVFAPGADGNAAPIRTIGVQNGVAAAAVCDELAVDRNGNIVCAFDESGLIQVFTNAPTGSGPPARTISLADSGASVREIIGLSLDPAGNIYVAGVFELNAGLPVSIVGFAGGTGGAETPINTLSSDALPNSVNARRLGFDVAGNLYVYELGTADSNSEPTVLRFTATANGFATPSTETLASFPILDGALAIAVD
jgi:hypothetical protein